MATKKQKRAAALVKHEKFMAEYRRQGLEALEADRARRAQRVLDEAKDKNERVMEELQRRRSPFNRLVQAMA